MWVEFKIEGFAWVDEGSVDEEDPRRSSASEILKGRILGVLPNHEGAEVSYEFAEGADVDADVKCECGGTKNVRAYNAGSDAEPDWLRECSECSISAVDGSRR